MSTVGGTRKAFSGGSARICKVKAAILPVLTVLAINLFLEATAQAQTPPSLRQIGTVKSVSIHSLTIATDAGSDVSVNVVEDARVFQLLPGDTDLKAAQIIKLGDIEVGDRVLVTGHSDAATAFTASRVILMKSGDIAQKQQGQREDWQKRGTGGLVNAVDTVRGIISITARADTIAVQTSPATMYRRYTGESVKYEDAVSGTLTQIQVGDQLRVRGKKSDDGTSIQAEEVVSGSFRNIAGTIVSIDTAAGTFKVNDLVTKKTYSVQVTQNSNLRVLEPDAAARLATQPASVPTATSPTLAEPARTSGSPESRSAGLDLSQMITRLPHGSLDDLHVGDALIVVATQSLPGSISLAAITVLSGVEPILAAKPGTIPSITLSPWSVGGPDGGGA